MLIEMEHPTTRDLTPWGRVDFPLTERICYGMLNGWQSKIKTPPSKEMEHPAGTRLTPWDVLSSLTEGWNSMKGRPGIKNACGDGTPTRGETDSVGSVEFL